MIFLGIDGGGTKTEFILCDEQGRALAGGQKESASHWQFSGDVLERVLREGVALILKQSGKAFSDIAAVGFGMSGYGESPEKDEKSTGICRSVFKDIPLEICNDVEVGLIASLGLECGIGVTSGTGAMAVGIDERGAKGRTGGWGHEIGDEGSGAWLGMKAVEIFTKQSDGRLKKTLFYDLFKERLRMTDDFDIISLFHDGYHGKRAETASLQKMLCDAARLGDPWAIQAYGRAADELALLAIALRDKLSFKEPVKVSYSGSIFKAGDFITKPFRGRLEGRGFIACEPRFTPIQGAMLLAARRVDMHHGMLRSLNGQR
jgi:N-acetylglucosamine kinase-like BadF-type ATPase